MFVKGDDSSSAGERWTFSDQAGWVRLLIGSCDRKRPI
jgi:hypothetical protein